MFKSLTEIYPNSTKMEPDRAGARHLGVLGTTASHSLVYNGRNTREGERVRFPLFTDEARNQSVQTVGPFSFRDSTEFKKAVIWVALLKRQPKMLMIKAAKIAAEYRGIGFIPGCPYSSFRVAVPASYSLLFTCSRPKTAVVVWP